MVSFDVAKSSEFGFKLHATTIHPTYNLWRTLQLGHWNPATELQLGHRHPATKRLSYQDIYNAKRRYLSRHSY